jgi:hypothetical protein
MRWAFHRHKARQASVFGRKISLFHNLLFWILRFDLRPVPKGFSVGLLIVTPSWRTERPILVQRPGKNFQVFFILLISHWTHLQKKRPLIMFSKSGDVSGEPCGSNTTSGLKLFLVKLRF